MSGVEAITRDALWQGRIILAQPARGQGYRFNLDPVLLAGFVPPSGRVLDLGSGCGVLGLVMLKLGRASQVTAVEIQSTLAELARQNGADNGFAPDQYDVICGDLRQVEPPRVETVVFNPPYFTETAGRGAADPGRDAARHERHGTLADFVTTGAAALEPGGRLCAIVPASRGEELRGLCAEVGLADQRSRSVRPRAEEPPNHLMLAARQGDSRLEELDPLVVHDSEGGFTLEVAALVEGPASLS